MIALGKGRQMLDSEPFPLLIGLECDSTRAGKGMIRTVGFNEARAREHLAAVIGRFIGWRRRIPAPPSRKTAPPQRHSSGSDLLAQRDRLDFQKVNPVTPEVLPRAGMYGRAFEIQCGPHEPAFV